MPSEPRNWSQWLRDKVRGLAWYPLQHEDATGLADEIDRLNAIIFRSGYDISPCVTCGEPTICLPDGIAPMCKECYDSGAEKSKGQDNAK